MPIDPAIIERIDSKALSLAVRQHVRDHGWSSVAKALREVVSMHVGWDSVFTELDNVLRRIIREFRPSDTTISPSSHLSQEPDIPNSPFWS